MPALKYSRQRESIKQFLTGRYDHPTADMVYMGVREEYPNISLGTVYRNLSLLAELGEIIKITGDGPDRFDANTDLHYHFVCKKCHAVLDLDLPPIAKLEDTASSHFNGSIEGHTATFYGICPDCRDSETEKQ